MKKYLSIIILVLIFIIIGYSFYNNKKQEEILNNEIIKLVNQDLYKDNYDIEIRSKGYYAKLEKKIKNHYKELSNNIKLINGYLNSQDLINILSIDNIKSNAPDYTESHNLLNNVRDKLNSSMALVNDLSSEESIKEIFEDKKIEYLKEDLKKLEIVKEDTKIIVDNLNVFLDKVEVILNFLKNNVDNWYIENNQLYFKSNKLVKEYNNLYNDLNVFVKEKFSKL